MKWVSASHTTPPPPPPHTHTAPSLVPNSCTGVSETELRRWRLADNDGLPPSASALPRNPPSLKGAGGLRSAIFRNFAIFHNLPQFIAIFRNFSAIFCFALLPLTPQGIGFFMVLVDVGQLFRCAGQHFMCVATGPSRSTCAVVENHVGGIQG